MNGKSLMVLRGEIKTPPMSEAARRETGFLLRRFNKEKILRFRTRAPCRTLARAATNCASTM
jgi:hypothetical protein